MEGGGQEYLNKTNTEMDCAALVIAQRSAATGATWSYGSKGCWAEFGDHIASSSSFRTCLFKSGKVFSINLINKLKINKIH